MDPNEQPDEPPPRAITIRLSPENIILAAAVVFLLAAVVLAVFFSMEQPAGTPLGTAVAVNSTPAETSLPSGTSATALPNGGGDYPAPPGTTLFPTFDTQGTQPYPGPNEPGQVTAQAISNATAPAATADGGFSPAPTTGNSSANQTTVATGATSAAVPTFEPARPTTTPSSGGAGGNNPYPAPGTAAPQPPGQTATNAPTRTVAPNQPSPTPTNTPPPPATSAPQPTGEPAGGADTPPTAAAPRPSATAVPPSPVPVDVVRGSMRWSASQSPILVRRDLQIAAGSSLVVEPGVEVKLAPGVAIYVDGKLYASGEPDKPVRFSSASGQRWDAIVGRPGGDIGLRNVEVSGGGNGGTLISSEGGNLTVLGARIRDNGGQIRVLDSRLEMRDSDVSGNDMPYGAAIEASYSGGGGIILSGNRIGGNKQIAGAPPVQVRNESLAETVNMDVQGNLMVGGNGPAMVVFTNGPLLGGMSCNAWLNGTDGLSIKSSALQVAPQVALTIVNNAIEDQTPPIIPEYLKYGIGRGASSDLYIDMSNNWWRSAEGPYHPDLHADGRGEAVGANITFAPWLTGRPACAPKP